MVDILSTLNKGGSGLDLRSLTTSLVAAEFQPRINTIEKSIAKTEASISAFGQLRSQMDKLRMAATAISETSIVEANSSSSAAAIKITDAAAIREGSSAIYVDALATRQVIEFPGFSSRSQTLGGGTMTVEIGQWVDIDTDQFVADPNVAPQSFSILADDTLDEIAEKLSKLDGVTARVLDKGDGTFSLGIVSEVGQKSALRLSVAEDPLTPGLSALDNATGAADHQIQDASDALIEIDGVVVTRPTNTIDDLVPGAILTLQDIGFTAVSVSRNADTAAENIEFLIETVNETLAAFATLTSRGADGQERGPLAGELASELAAGQIRALMAGPIGGYSERPVTLGEMGVVIRRDGTYTFDRNTFDKAFEKNPKFFEAAFADRLDTSRTDVQVKGFPATQSPFGTYAFIRENGTGPATIAGEPAFEIPMGDGRSDFLTFGGPLSGITLTVPDGVADVSINHAKSFMSILTKAIDDLMAGSAQLTQREDQLTGMLNDYKDEMTALDAKAVTVEDRYMEKFVAMELAITQLNSTGDYLTNLIDSWNNQNN